MKDGLPGILYKSYQKGNTLRNKANFLSNWFWVYAQSLRLCLVQKMSSLDGKMALFIEILIVTELLTTTTNKKTQMKTQSNPSL